MRQRIIINLFCVIPLFVFAQKDSTGQAYSQNDTITHFFKGDTTARFFTLQEVFSLALKNSYDIKQQSTLVDVVRQNTAIERNKQLPSVNALVTAGYLGNTLIIPKNFKNDTTIHVPHFSNEVSLMATELIFNGNNVNFSIQVASLLTQIEQLQLDNKTQDTKLMAAAYYFDLMNGYNQLRVYEENLKLAYVRLNLAMQYYEQGIITRDYVYRTQYQIANLKYEVVSLQNNIRLYNKELSVITGTPDTVMIIPDNTLLKTQPFVENLEFYQQRALQNLPDNKAAVKDIEVSEKELAITRTEQIPSFYAYGTNDFKRPVTSSTPAMAAWTNGWQVGILMSYDISSIYTTPKKLAQNRLQIKQAKEKLVLQQQNASADVANAFLQNKSAQADFATQDQNVKLANETYRIVELKFYNQIATIIDILNATDQKLDAELSRAKAQVNILYSYILLLRYTGDL